MDSEALVDDDGMTSKRTSPARAARAASCVCALAMIAVVVLAERYAFLLDNNVSDDAMTSMQYARNLASGHGLVFNVGERVEGYTNFLWVLVMTPLYALSKAYGLPFVPIVNQLNIAIAVAITGLVYWLGSRIWGRGHLATWVAVFLLVIDNSFTTWAVLGLEVQFLGLWMLLALIAVRSTNRFRAVLAGFALLGAHLTRPDAALFCICIIGNELAEALLDWRRGDRRAAARIVRDAAISAAVWVLPYGVYFAWRYGYYGWPFPNTYYVKLGGEIDGWARGIAYTLEFLEVRAWVPIVGLLAIFAARDRTVRVLIIYLAVHVLYVVYAGGDFMRGHRFFVPQLPEFALLVGAAVAVTWKWVQPAPGRRWLATSGAPPHMIAGLGWAAALALLAFLGVRERELGPIDMIVATWGHDLGRQRVLMAWLKEKMPRGATFATGTIGHAGFLTDAYVIDVCGIIDPVIAHMKVKDFGHGFPGHEKIASVDYVMKKKPTYIHLDTLREDLWRYGYYFDADVPPRTVDGIWVRDTLQERGRYIESTRIDFDDGKPLDGWTATGTAFERYPMNQKGPGQGDISGALGEFINTNHPKLAHAATGMLRSAPFEMIGDDLVFRLAGGHDPERLRVSLWVGGKMVRAATGRRSNVMARQTWDIRPYRGKMAEIQILDDTTEPWGYIVVDDIVQWQANTAP